MNDVVSMPSASGQLSVKSIDVSSIRRLAVELRRQAEQLSMLADAAEADANKIEAAGTAVPTASGVIVKALSEIGEEHDVP